MVFIRWHTIQRYLPLLASFVFFAILFYTNAVVTTIADRIAPYFQPALPDIGHKLLPYWPYFQINNYWIIISYVFIFIRFLPQSGYPCHRLSSMVLRARNHVWHAKHFHLCHFADSSSTRLYDQHYGTGNTGRRSVLRDDRSTCDLWRCPFSRVIQLRVSLRLKSIKRGKSRIINFSFFLPLSAVTICALCWTTYARGEEYSPFSFSSIANVVLQRNFVVLAGCSTQRWTPSVIR